MAWAFALGGAAVSAIGSYIGGKKAAKAAKAQARAANEAA